MKKEELDFILEKGEGYFVEFKSNIDKGLSKEIVAFANSSGGKVFLGVDDNNKAIGINITKYDEKDLKMNNAGVLFFSDSIFSLIEQATITCVVFEGLERINVINRKDYTEDIITNIDNALQFVKQALKVKYKMTGESRREEIYEIPALQ